MPRRLTVLLLAAAAVSLLAARPLLTQALSSGSALAQAGAPSKGGPWPWIDAARAQPDPDFPAATPAEEGVRPERLEALDQRARETDTGALLVARHGRLVMERYFGKFTGKARARGFRLLAQSITKSVTSLLVGILLDEGLIPSLDAPVSLWYPEWANHPRKSRITLRMLLNQTSGIVEGAGFWREPDLLSVARALEPMTEPGMEFHYSNAGVELLSGVIERAAGMPVDRLAAERLLGPLGFTHWKWDRDARGTVATSGGLRVQPRDLLKLGELVVEEGEWRGQSLVSPAWIRASLRPSQPFAPQYGLLWWLPQAAGVREVAAIGWQGQYLVVVPGEGLIAVRMRASRDVTSAEENLSAGWPDFPRDVAELLR